MDPAAIRLDLECHQSYDFDNLAGNINRVYSIRWNCSRNFPQKQVHDPLGNISRNSININPLTPRARRFVQRATIERYQITMGFCLLYYRRMWYNRSNDSGWLKNVKFLFLKNCSMTEWWQYELCFTVSEKNMENRTNDSFAWKYQLL